MSRTNYYNKIRSTPKEFPIPLDEIQSVGDTFLQFCLEHGLPETSREIDGENQGQVLPFAFVSLN